MITIKCDGNLKYAQGFRDFQNYIGGTSAKPLKTTTLDNIYQPWETQIPRESAFPWLYRRWRWALAPGSLKTLLSLSLSTYEML